MNNVIKNGLFKVYDEINQLIYNTENHKNKF